MDGLQKERNRYDAYQNDTIPSLSLFSVHFIAFHVYSGANGVPLIPILHCIYPLCIYYIVYLRFLVHLHTLGASWRFGPIPRGPIPRDVAGAVCCVRHSTRSHLDFLFFSGFIMVDAASSPLSIPDGPWPGPPIREIVASSIFLPVPCNAPCPFCGRHPSMSCIRPSIVGIL